MWYLRLGKLSNESISKNLKAILNGPLSTIDKLISPRISKTNMLIALLFVMMTNYVIRKMIRVLLENNLQTLALKIGLRVPVLKIYMKNYMIGQLNKLYNAMDGMFYQRRPFVYECIPEEPFNPEAVEKDVMAVHEDQYAQYSSGLHSGTIYHSESKELNTGIRNAMGVFSDADAFNYDTFKGVSQLNADIANITIRLFGGDEDTVAFTTSGGTESICCAIAAYKFWARDEKGITKPNLITYQTAHAAFSKG